MPNRDGKRARTAETDTNEKTEGKTGGRHQKERTKNRTEQNRTEELDRAGNIVCMYVYITCEIGSSRWLGGNRDLTETKR